MESRRARRRHDGAWFSTPNKRDPPDRTLVQKARRRDAKCVVHRSLPIQKALNIVRRGLAPQSREAVRINQHTNVVTPTEVDHDCPLSISAREKYMKVALLGERFSIELVQP